MPQKSFDNSEKPNFASQSMHNICRVAGKTTPVMFYLHGLNTAPKLRCQSEKGYQKSDQHQFISYSQLVFHLSFLFFMCIYSSSSTTDVLQFLYAATHETEQRDHDFCINRSHYTDTGPTSREQAATAGIKLTTSSPGVARSTDLQLQKFIFIHVPLLFMIYCWRL